MITRERVVRFVWASDTSNTFKYNTSNTSFKYIVHMCRSFVSFDLFCFRYALSDMFMYLKESYRSLYELLICTEWHVYVSKRVVSLAAELHFAYIVKPCSRCNVHVWICVCIYTYKMACIERNIGICFHRCVYEHIRIHTYIQSYMWKAFEQMNIHTYIHTYMWEAFEHADSISTNQ